MRTKKILYLLTFAITLFIAANSLQIAFSKDSSEKTTLEKTTKAAESQSTQKSPAKEEVPLSKKTLLVKASIIFLILALSLLAYLILKIAYRKFNKLITEEGVLRESDRTLRLRTLAQLGYWLGTITLFLAIIYMILRECGVDVAPILAGMGIVGLAFGFGGQYLIRDIISGIFILFEDQYHINHVIKVNNVAGLVEKITLRITVLRDLDGSAIFIPNGEIKTVINLTKEWSRAVFDIAIAYKENVDQVIAVIKELGQEIRKDPYFGKLILEDLEMLGVDGFGDSSVNLKFTIKTIPIKQWEVAREFRRRLKNRFDALGIEIPFPHRTLYLGTGADNDFMKKFFQFKMDGGK